MNPITAILWARSSAIRLTSAATSLIARIELPTKLLANTSMCAVAELASVLVLLGSPVATARQEVQLWPIYSFSCYW
jgi:hypothetical protein